MKQPVKLLVVISVGPFGSQYTLEQLCDTVGSIVHYTTADRKIILQDSSAPLQVGKKVREQFPEVIISPSPKHYGSFGGTYMADSLAFLTLHNSFDYRLLVRLDVDALWTGYGLEDEVIDYFAAHPKVGILANLPEKGEDLHWVRRMMMREGRSLYGMLRKPRRYFMLNRLMQTAQATGWKIGDHVMGGAMIFNPALIQKWIDKRLLLRDEIGSLTLHDHHIYSLLCRSVDMTLDDYGLESSHGATLAQGLAATPERAAEQGVKLVRSVRRWRGRSEDEVRAYFRQRQQTADVTKLF
mgnify:CR=1 FL=1